MNAITSIPTAPLSPDPMMEPQLNVALPVSLRTAYVRTQTEKKPAIVPQVVFEPGKIG